MIFAVEIADQPLEPLAKFIERVSFFVADWLAMVEGQAGVGVKSPTRNI
jgi:hypothetical protein